MTIEAGLEEAVGAAAETAVSAETQAAESATPSDPLERLALEAGWTPKDKWDRDPDKHLGPEAYLAKSVRKIGELSDAVRRSGAMTEKLVREERTKAYAQAKADLETAKASGDADAVEDATKRVVKAESAASEPPDEVKAYASRNSWLGSNRAATNLAVSISAEIADKGGSVADQIEAADKEVRKRFPELFGDQPRRQEKRPPEVEGGQRSAGPGAKRAKGVADLPSEAKTAMKDMIKRGIYASEDEYAKDFWSHQETKQ